ncbi:MAG: hypothetical protein PHG27_05760 [Massilibacteroides sp.]|nr:hypothetical protein [Massilibacteroides sp.]MDD3061795.1 hypothetical protein [Massilibacteroides sp.]MDD4115090.1 hypothetical protein [Massilibacteroides sp.]MDD4660077.1 hypothetical protein [Massilibacteroides sp.]
MGEKQHELNHLKRQNPFRVPEGYMVGLTDQIMRQLPEKNICKKKISLIIRLRPWVAAAAVVVGLGFFINIFIGLDKQTTSSSTDSLWIQAQMPPAAISKAQAAIDDEYLEYLEARYSNYILEEEFADSE